MTAISTTAAHTYVHASLHLTRMLLPHRMWPMASPAQVTTGPTSFTTSTPPPQRCAWQLGYVICLIKLYVAGRGPTSPHRVALCLYNPDSTQTQLQRHGRPVSQWLSAAWCRFGLLCCCHVCHAASLCVCLLHSCHIHLHGFNHLMAHRLLVLGMCSGSLFYSHACCLCARVPAALLPCLMV